MPHSFDPTLREPKGDHSRRLALGLDPEVFAAHAGITVDQLTKYEMTGPDGDFDVVITNADGAAFERLANKPSKPAPLETDPGGDDNIDDLGRKQDGTKQEQPGKTPPAKP